MSKPINIKGKLAILIGQESAIVVKTAEEARGFATDTVVLLREPKGEEVDTLRFCMTHSDIKQVVRSF